MEDHNIVENLNMNEEPSVRRRLTMKILHRLILELQGENLHLARQIAELEQQVHGFQQFRGEAAAAEAPSIHAGLEVIPNEGNLPIWATLKVKEPEIANRILTGALEEPPQSDDTSYTILTPRSEKHPALKKKSFFRRY